MSSFLRFRRAAFSLVELIVVIAIIAIIATFTIPAATTILRGTALNQAQQMVVDQFRLARQTALSRGHAVEIRFLQFADVEQPGETASNPATGQYRAIQVFEVLDNGVALPVDKPQRFPATVIMNSAGTSSNNLSSLLKAATQTVRSASADTRAIELPRGVKRNYNWVAVRFQPDGSTTLPMNLSTPWYLTIHEISSASITTIPAGFNFLTIQLDPGSGSIRTYRPTAG
jgi:uncharacterized protein (TIGR02596 family)